MLLYIRNQESNGTAIPLLLTGRNRRRKQRFVAGMVYGKHTDYPQKRTFESFFQPVEKQTRVFG